MEEKLLHMLQDVGYTGPVLDSDKLSQALQGGAKSPDFTGLVAWFTEQLATFIDIDETVHATTSGDDASSFLLELSFFLKEIGCVNEKLMTGHVNQRLANESERAILIEFLVTELMAAKLLEVKCPKEEKQMEVTIDESDTARNLKNMLVTLKFQKPPDNITPALLFSRLQTKLSEELKTVPPDHLGKPLIDVELSAKQWEQLADLQKEMHEEYTIRREMLLKRLDVTVQSFLWSDRIKSQEAKVNSKYEEKRKTMKSEPKVSMADLLAARDDLAVIEKTSNASVRKNTRSKINSVIIGAVPDRGGRPYEQEPPPPEMPPWQKDRVQGPPSFRNRNIPDMDIESVIRIIGTQEVIKGALAVGVEETEDTGETLAEIIVRIMVKITVKVTARITIISSRSTLAKETLTGVIIAAGVTIIRTGERAAEEEVAEFRVDGTKVAIIAA
ncbi:hypothetical protein DMN91_003417 [Ooceraea biroi]|uniref:Protein FAM98A n=1 Tax=Ooceraea biroi TaxID=2015173 RepID=A0A3L8DS30_OOCBI|nr:hypothetical protein DMN91_003417 [Ooceraea biroi]